MLRLISLTLSAFLLLSSGCASMKNKVYRIGPMEISFPGGTIIGGASSDQAGALAEMLVASHEQHMKAFDEQKELSRKNLETAEKTLRILEEVSHRQGAGEITLFFETGSAAMPAHAFEFERLVRFVDHVSAVSSGRLVHFVLIGSASATGLTQMNTKLSKQRSEAPIQVIDKYLVNIPHKYYRIAGVGDMYSPKRAEWKVHERYQHVRIIAAYATDRLPELPAELKESKLDDRPFP
ncbi:MAG: hypothetical protein AB1641_21425 [Thermodesulfobacteriota bacterium]